jgi:predicted RNase H-related nuclease YkuK (DUF458 family)
LLSYVHNIKFLLWLCEYDYVVKSDFADFAVKYQIFERGSAFAVFPIDYHTVGNLKDLRKLLLTDAAIHIEFARLAISAAIALVKVELGADVSAEVDIVVAEEP